jgi:PBP1b-binding outer membrane lipoprotein LpoB
MKAYYLPVALLGAALFSGCTTYTSPPVTVTPAPVTVAPATPSTTYVVPPSSSTVVVPAR